MVTVKKELRVISKSQVREENIRRNRIKTISLASGLSLWSYFVCSVYTKIVNPSRTTIVKEHAKKLRK